MASLESQLANMPDGWGKVLNPPVHPSKLAPPTCPRKYMYRTRLGWRKKSWERAPEIGRIFHAVLAGILAGGAPQEVSSAVSLDAEEAVREIHDIIAEEQTPTEADYFRKDARKQIAVGLMLGQVLYSFHPLRDTHSILAVEQRIDGSIDLPGRSPVEIAGTLDAVVQDNKTDNIYIVDHKSTSFHPRDFAQSLTFDTQTALYRYLWDEAHPDFPSSGVMHQIIRKPTIRLKKAETLEDYINRCFEWYEAEAARTIHDPPVLISRCLFSTAHSLEKNEEVQRLLWDAHGWAQRPLHLPHFPRVGDPNAGCLSRFGGVCSYMTLCQHRPVAWAELLEKQQFTKVDRDAPETPEE